MSRFDRFMVSNAIGTNRKLRRLPVVQRWVYVAGVLGLASQSPMRGALLITDDEPATAEDLAQEATVKVADARAALASFRKLGMLDRDENGVEWVHDWDAMNPAPKPSDSPEAARKRKREQRDRERAEKASVPRDIGVTDPDCHAPEVEGEVGRKTESGAGEPLKPALNDKRLTETLAILETAPRLVFDLERMGVFHMLNAHPAADHVKAAHTVVARVADPAYNTTNAARALEFAFHDLERQQRPRGGSGPRATTAADRRSEHDRLQDERRETALRVLSQQPDDEGKAA